MFRKTESNNTHPIYLLLTRTDWNEPPRARHQLANSLISHGRVVFVSLNKRGKPSLFKQDTNEGIELIVPSWFISGKYVYRIPILNELYQLWLLSKLSRYYRNSKVILFDPSGWLTHIYFKNSIYYCNDDFLDIRRSKNRVTQSYFKISQKAIAKNSIYNVAVSNYLHDNLSKYSNRTKLILTGASSVSKEKERKNRNPGLINLVYVGWLSKINSNWVVEASNIPNIRIQLIGPFDKKDVICYENIENIEILGPKVSGELHPYLLQADIGIAPYIMGRDTELVYTVPNKFWLYLSYGIPVVTHEIKNLFDFPDYFVYQAKSSNSFKMQIKKAINQNSLKLSKDRVSFIDDNGWDNRANEILKLFK